MSAPLATPTKARKANLTCRQSTMGRKPEPAAQVQIVGRYLGMHNAAQFTGETNWLKERETDWNSRSLSRTSPSGGSFLRARFRCPLPSCQEGARRECVDANYISIRQQVVVVDDERSFRRCAQRCDTCTPDALVRSGTRDRFEARYLGERGFIDRIDGDSRTHPLEPIAPAGDGTDHGHAGAADIFEIDLCSGHGLGPRCLARRRRPKLTRGRRRFSDTMRLSTAACHPGRPRLPDRC